MRVSVVWHTPGPERTIAVAMRRCYSTKPIEEIQTELDQKGPEYWKYLLTRAVQDKSLDVIEHYCVTLAVDGIDRERVGTIVRHYPHARFLELGDDGWLVSMNGRTLMEMWRGDTDRDFASAVVSELNTKGVSPIFNQLAFGDTNAS